MLFLYFGFKRYSLYRNRREVTLFKKQRKVEGQEDKIGIEKKTHLESQKNQNSFNKDDSLISFDSFRTQIPDLNSVVKEDDWFPLLDKSAVIQEELATTKNQDSIRDPEILIKIDEGAIKQVETNEA